MIILIIIIILSFRQHLCLGSPFSERRMCIHSNRILLSKTPAGKWKTNKSRNFRPPLVLKIIIIIRKDCYFFGNTTMCLRKDYYVFARTTMCFRKEYDVFAKTTITIALP